MNNQGTINNVLIEGVKRRKSLKVIQRYLRMKYRINISSATLGLRAERAKIKIA